MNIAGYITGGSGNTTITNYAGDMVIASTAKVRNSLNSDLKIENKEGSGALSISGLVHNRKIGDINIINSGSGALEIAITANIVTANGRVEITNTDAGDGGLNISGKVQAKGGQALISNAGAAGALISGIISAKGGKTIISNAANDFVLAESSIIENLSANTDIEIGNDSTGKLKLKGTVRNKVSGDTILSYVGQDGAEITGTIINTDGETIYVVK